MLSLPLTSLSTAQDADAQQQKFSWQKETQDLTFVIDSYGGRDNTQLIKVVQGTRVRVRDIYGRCLSNAELLTTCLPHTH